MTDDTLTTDGSSGEQAFESTVDDAVAFFEVAFAADDTDKTTTSPDDQFPTDSSAGFGEHAGIGKPARHVEAIAAVSDHDEIETEWIDPKADAQNDDGLPTEYIEGDS